MKKNTLLLIALLFVAIAATACDNSNQVLPDTQASKPLPPGTKTKDVLMPIDK